MSMNETGRTFSAKIKITVCIVTIRESTIRHLLAPELEDTFADQAHVSRTVCTTCIYTVNAPPLQLHILLHSTTTI